MRIDEEALARAVEQGTFTGVVTVDVGDERVLEQAHGFAHRAAGVRNTPATRFGVASGSKVFTALAVLRLVEDGALDLGTRVRDVLDDDLPDVDDGVTVQHLLTHTSGIGDYLDEEAAWDPHDHVLRTPVHLLGTAEAFLPELTGFAQVSPPGERFAYNNGGYVVLAVVAERTSGRTFHDLVRTEVIDRAGLTTTDHLRSDDLPGDAALGYLDAEGNAWNVLHLPVLGTGDGGAWTTADDLHRFWRALLDGRVVSRETVAWMVRPRHDVPGEDLRSGAGVFLHPTGEALVVEGYDAGVSFRSTHDPATATTVTVLGNSSEGAWPVIGALAPLFD
ncbi:CubicO group peptidase (beta-lactamase class C family) [Isoptericola jiangsuensis]|uniref:CubicO group peptidase (Beta-lactamase class C family) n=1 Tax=Isoptericola jiangsuensis TaxID=548579 RepID=A0A2A9F017_9MICO|nr:serine hydrolase domain-containing protein [Isoptericola jiangsuensis]PFG44478.1 CubicO group peptidase (beta-lactamase class C family) [Isoptericola jiangsuensis]